MKEIIFDIQQFAELSNDVNNTVVTGTANDDEIYNSGSYVTIDGLGGNDTITNEYGHNVTINGGEGNDSITNDGGNNIIINGGAGNDTIINLYGDGVTITGGEGDDSISGSPEYDTFIYSSGNDTIDNYPSYGILSWAANYTSWGTDGTNLVINAAEGSVRITDVKNKWVEIADAEGNVGVHVYISSDYAGAIDEREFSGLDVMIGSNNVSNQLFAGAGGSSLWGGIGGNDELYGNSGVDEFFYAYGNGQDNLFNVSNEDVVNLNGVSLEQLAVAQINDYGVSLEFTDGGSLNVNGQAGTFLLGGRSYGADYQNKIWYEK